MVWEMTQDTAAPDQSLLSAITRTIRGRPFDDVLPSDWYWKEVTAAWDAGLMRGTGGRTFSPGRTLTLAEAVALTARLHDRFHNGSDTLSPGPLWYRPYLDYALEQDILPALPAPETLNSPVTRAGFALLLDRAPPSLCPPRDEHGEAHPRSPGASLCRAGGLPALSGGYPCRNRCSRFLPPRADPYPGRGRRSGCAHGRSCPPGHFSTFNLNRRV